MPRVIQQRIHQPQNANSASIVKGRTTAIWRLKQAFPQSLRLGIGLIGISSAIFWGNDSLAEITPDGSVNFSLTTDTINGAPATRITGGVQQDTNLFHSFAQFNVNLGQRVYFTDPGVNNILSRVTGNSSSIIQGVLGVDGAANLFLLNPKGIIFGLNSSLDVRGSFVGTPANAIEFGTQEIFSATPSAVPILTVNPWAFLFNQIAAASITNQSTPGLQVPDGKSLLLVGGEVRLEGGILRAPGGRIELGGLTEPGKVTIDISAQAYLGTGGSINLNALKLYRIGQNSDDFLNTNDITVSSRYGRTGEYRGNVLNPDPTQGLTNLPVEPVDTSRLIAQRCALRSRTSPTQENKFTVTQRGGLPPNPNETLQNDSVVTNWVTLDSPGEKPTSTANTPPPTPPLSKSSQYVEAQRWVLDEKGEVVLTAQAPTATPNPTLTPVFSCHGS